MKFDKTITVKKLLLKLHVKENVKNILKINKWVRERK